ncbi:Rad2 nuclease [Madurella fahalii]|uniref:Rad2 nuclease n=1 Tax=Madurella fahalii TaxID=1157608 RepID=A0ABQ0GIM1_9PEZI
MGISGLLPLLKSIHRPSELKKYAGDTLGVDGYGWLHRGAVACAIELAQGKPTRKYVDFAMHRVRMFKHFGVTPYLVFDGDFLPSKAKTEASREKRREESRKIGLELLRAGKPAQAHSELQKAIDVTPDMARHLIEELKKAQVPYVVAPYEADAQLVYLERQGLISGIVSEDSDLLVFGAKRLLTKMDKYGQCIEINRRDFCAVREISLTDFTDNEFRYMAIFSGCDYLDGINNVGLKKAYRLIRMHKTPERIIKMLRFGGKHQVPNSYLEDFKQAELTFLHQRVFCPIKQDIVLLTEPDPSVNVNDMPFIGAPVETELARSIAVGDINPITKQRILVPLSPGKRTISQALAAPSVPTKSLGKPINQYFAARRVPLGEMDPNCFAVEPNTDTDRSENAPRPVVFPLPRPYLDDAGPSSTPTRPYTSSARGLRRQSEPISNILLGLNQTESSQHRRRTTGPIVQVYHDPSPSTRPPKKARLCEDSVIEDAVSKTPERSRFFSSSKRPKPARERVDQILMSDDSVEEAFRSLPDFGSWCSEKPARPAEEITIFEEASPRRQKEDAASAEAATESHDNSVDEVVEVPRSSPVQQQKAGGAMNREPTSMTPLGRLLKDFSYETAQPRTRVARGLYTPASSTQQTATPTSTTRQDSRVPLSTPLQRIRAQAMQRGKTGSTSSTPRTPISRIISRKSDSFSDNPAFVPLPKVNVAEVEALGKPLGSEDQIVPDSDAEEEEDGENEGSRAPPSARRLNLSKFLYS